MSGDSAGRVGTPIRSHRDLTIWRNAMTLVEEIYRLTRGFPPDERFGLTTQMRRSVVSVPSNIAEGHGRTGRAEFLHGLSVANGSLLECSTQLEIAGRLGYVADDVARDVLSRMSGLSRGIRALRRSWRSG